MGRNWQMTKLPQFNHLIVVLSSKGILRTSFA